MKQSILFTKTTRQDPKDEQSINARLLIRAGYIGKLIAGVYTFLPLGQIVLKKIEDIIREEMDSIGGQEILMPTLQPRENWERTGRWEAMDDLYKVKDTSGREFALGPTHEEVVVPLVQNFVNSYKDLPLYVYQFQNKFRMELRAKSGLLRGREFLMKDLYSFHLDEKDMDEYYEKAKDAYFRIFKHVGIEKETYLTFASGGSFSKYSHEFQTITPAGEDIIHICDACHLAVNKEILEDSLSCPQCGGKFGREAKAVEVGNIFKLKNKYTKPFNMAVTDEKGERNEVVMGCYGIGLGRLMATIVEVHNDGKGIVWPDTVAPFKIHLISLGRNEEAEKIYNSLKGQKIEVLLDDRELSAGEKFADADLLGMPVRVVVSAKSLAAGGVEVKKRGEEKSEIVGLDKVGELI
jgi:prolyl-tRNA synthetase